MSGQRPGCWVENGILWYRQFEALLPRSVLHLLRVGWLAAAIPGLCLAGCRPSGDSDSKADQAAEERFKQKVARLSDAELEATSRKLLVPSEREEAFSILEMAGKRATPHVVSLLRAPALLKPEAGETGLSAYGALEEALNLIVYHGPPEAAPILAPWVKHPVEVIRKVAARAIGSIATDECIEPIKSVLTDPADSVRTFGMMGISSALGERRGNPAFFSNISHVCLWSVPSPLGRSWASGHVEIEGFLPNSVLRLSGYKIKSEKSLSEEEEKKKVLDLLELSLVKFLRETFPECQVTVSPATVMRHA